MGKTMKAYLITGGGEFIGSTLGEAFSPYSTSKKSNEVKIKKC